MAVTLSQAALSGSAHHARTTLLRCREPYSGDLAFKEQSLVTTTYVLFKAIALHTQRDGHEILAPSTVGRYGGDNSDGIAFRRYLC